MKCRDHLLDQVIEAGIVHVLLPMRMLYPDSMSSPFQFKDLFSVSSSGAACDGVVCRHFYLGFHLDVKN